MATEQHQSIRGRYAARLLDDVLTERYRLSLPRRGDGHPVELPDWRIPDGHERLPRADPPLPYGKVGIVGAGVAGLYLAMMCDFLGIQYELLESSGRVGGRVYTYEFPQSNPAIRHNYYDVGAMRFPVLNTMKPVQQLIDHLKLQTAPYYLSSNSTPNLFNNAAISSQAISTILQPLDDAVNPIIQKLTENFDEGFAALMLLDKYSTRQYLMTEQGMPFAKVQQLETFNTSTGLFDQAFSETVLDYFDFNVANTWYRLEDGTSVLTTAMHNSITTKALLQKRVNNIAYNEQQQAITVGVDGETASRSYYAAFNTTTMGCLGHMDTSALQLSTDQQMAVRALSYDRSCKIAIKFSRAWWVGLGVAAASGGSSATDLPIRTTVFPSWIDGDASKPAVLICSYTWALDATKVGSLIASPSNPTQNAKLLDLVLKNLARVFGNKISYKDLQGLVLSHHAYAWSHDPNTAGAFALFGPGQFTNLYPAVQLPAANGRFYMVGEAVSAHHAWIVGALDSAYMQLLQFLVRFGQLEKANKLKNSWFGGGTNQHPDEMVEKHLYWKVKLSIDEDLGF